MTKDPRTPTSLADQRQEYALGGLRRAELEGTDPMTYVQLWLDDALAAEVPEPTAMTLATADASGRCSARTVLLKGLDEDGFVFFTNYESRKGGDLKANPQAALLFFWPQLQRQIRIEGTVERVSAQVSDRYFASRPRGSRLGAVASPQSQVIEDRDWLEDRLDQATKRYQGGDVSRPAGWGGYRLAPTSIEFWQGRPNRLHDRLRCRRESGEETSSIWVLERLAP